MASSEPTRGSQQSPQRSTRARPLVLSDADRNALEHLVRSGTEEQRLVLRARIVLGAATGATNTALSGALGTTRNTVTLWRERFDLRRHESPEAPARALLADNPRPGAPDRIQPEQWVDILAVATAEPKAFGVEETHWSSATLAAKVLELRLVGGIHRTTVSRFLANCRLKPHRVVGWMNRKEDKDFEPRAAAVKHLFCQAVAEDSDPTHAVISYDEKTGMQAKERIADDKPMRVDEAVKHEYEYRRHGTRALLAALLVHTGRVMGAVMSTRTNDDTALVLRAVFSALFGQGYARITIVMDQLNTHMSEPMVQLVAELCGVPLPSADILGSMATRRAWLEETGRRITFLFTPRHASWLNPIETWFGTLSRKLLRRGSFKSCTDLEERLVAFIDYYNAKLAHPYTYRELNLRRPSEIAA